MSIENKLLNRDISWLSFNLRVSDEANKKSNTLAERVKFHGIAFSNLDEFLQVRYPSAMEEYSNSESQKVATAVGDHYQTLAKRFQKFNKEFRIVRKIDDLDKGDRKWAEKYFTDNVFPALLPVTIDKAREANIRSGMYILLVTEDDDGEQLGYVEIPNCIDRFIPIPGKHAVIAVEDLVQTNIKSIIRGRKVEVSFPFTVRRSAEVFLQPDRYMDPYALIKETLHEREKSWITAVEIGTTKKKYVDVLRKVVPIGGDGIIIGTSMIQLRDLKNIPEKIFKDSDKSRKLKIRDTFPSTGIFNYIKEEDRLCFHPYESYDSSTVRFLEEASTDPDVVSIRICLYRVSNHSRIIDALLKAADTGKLVTVLVELKARFDEKRNMEVATILKEGGVRIVYTKPDIKTHAKVCLITRKEKKGLRIYSHIGTGNYSEVNSRLYTDYSYFTADRKIGEDLTKFFNLLTSDQDDFKSRKIIYAPYNLKSTIIDGINRQIKRAKDKKSASITIKCNALTDIGVAKRLIAAASEGVEITLIIRSACIIQPQKNIRIVSIVGQQLEHSRIVVFGSGKDSQVYIGSSDMMTRNLSRRNELMLLIEPENLKKRILHHVEMYLKDTVNQRIIQKDYGYKDAETKKDKKPFNCHAEFAKEAKHLVTED